jgi:hypothetical protein
MSSDEAAAAPRSLVARARLALLVPVQGPNKQRRFFLNKKKGSWRPELLRHLRVEARGLNNLGYD